MPLVNDPTRLIRLQGVVSIADYVATAAYNYRDMGNCLALTIEPQIETLDHREMRSGRMQIDKKIETQRDCMINCTFDSFAALNLSRYLMGTITNNALQGSAVNENVVGYQGGRVVLSRINLTAFNSLSNGSTVLTKDTGRAPISTVFDATNDNFTAVAHGLTNGTKVKIVAETLPAGFSATTNYFVIGATTDTFQISTTYGGSAALATSAGAGVTVVVVPDYKINLGSGVIQFATDANFTDGETLVANYRAGASESVESLTLNNREYSLILEGINTAENDAPVRLQVYRMFPEQLPSMDLIQENEFAQFEFQFKALLTDGKTFKLDQLAAA